MSTLDVDFIMGINYPANKQAGTFLLCKFTLPYQLDSVVCARQVLDQRNHNRIVV